ncbi:MAG: hypothetical protein SPD11_00185 [Sphaerochaetaceae bacterium]|nr:hypothetical protein [Sphaerochaetaceae bacterium]
MDYHESYRDLCHGTTKKFANAVLKNGFLIQGDSTSWCGKGVCFYDIKAKAWWAAQRKCHNLNLPKDSAKEMKLDVVPIGSISRYTGLSEQEIATL